MTTFARRVHRQVKTLTLFAATMMQKDDFVINYHRKNHA